MPIALMFQRLGEALHGLFSSNKRYLCSELIAEGFYKEGDFVFGKPAELVLPAEFDDAGLFEEVETIA